MSKNILHTILETKNKELEILRTSTDLSVLQQAAADAPPPRDFYSALASKPQPGRRMNVIAEIKKASPSKGLIRDDFDPPTLARAYQAGGANALSVLTDEQYFQGSLDFLQQVRQVVDLPLLRKDFLIDPWQLYQARAAGADAVLLIVAALDDQKMVELMQLAQQLGMTVLLEIHTAEELQRWQAIKPTVLQACPGFRWLLGVNNRDLTTFDVDVQTTIRLAELADDDEVIIGESGIAVSADVQLLADHGVRGVLVGESFMRKTDVTQAVNDLLNE